MIKKCLIDGGCGFIGGHLTHKLKSLGHNVLVIDNLSTGKLENIPNNCNFEKIDICDINKLDNIFKSYKPNIIFHLAALPRVQFSIKNPELTHNTNINGTFNLLLKSKEYNVDRFIYSSSSSIYGYQKTFPLTEDMKPNPMSPYALQKLTGEYYCNLFYKIYSLKTISLRYFNCYGKNMNLDSNYACMIPKFINLVLHNKQPVIFGDGENTRAYTFISDVVNANIISGFNIFKEDEVFGRCFNIGAEIDYSVNDVVDKINKLANKNIKPIYIDPVIEPKNTKADLNLSKTILRWSPKVDFKEGLIKTFNYYKQGDLKWVERKR
jgi:nucleoside-diphosphate-sugar epimerase